MGRLGKVFRKESSYKAFFASLLSFALAYGLYKGVIDNYLAEVVGMTSFDKGVSEFFRELPGFMLVLVLAAMYLFSAQRIYKIGSVIMLVGMVILPIIPATKALVTMTIFIYSLGEHMQLAMRQTMTLEFAQKDCSGEALGYQSSVYQIGTLIGYLFIILLFLFIPSSVGAYRGIFFASSAIIAVGVLSTTKIGGASHVDGHSSRFYFRRKFGKFYMLEVFYGARKQVFFTFGPYVLVLFYGSNAMVISLLFAISAICCFIASPYVGKTIDRFGYKVVMVSDTLILVIVCFFYGFAHHMFPKDVAFIVCCVNYVLDSVISLASMASNVYVKDLSESPEEMKATISTGMSVNHLITILIALFGGLIWQVLGIETLFIISAVLGLCNSAYAATIKTSKAA